MLHEYELYDERLRRHCQRVPMRRELGCNYQHASGRHHGDTTNSGVDYKLSVNHSIREIIHGLTLEVFSTRNSFQSERFFRTKLYLSY